MPYPDDGSTPLSDPNSVPSALTANLRDAYGWPIVGGILDTGGGPRSVAEMLRPAPQWGLGAFGSVNPLPDASGLFGQGLANPPATLSGAGEPAATRSLSNPGILSDPDGVSSLSVPAFIDPQAWQDLHDMTLHGDPDAVEEMLRLPPPAATGPLGSMFAGRTAGANGGTAFGDPKAASFSAGAPQTDDLSQVSTPDLISMWVNHPDNPLFAQPAVPDRGDIVPAVWRGDADALNAARKSSTLGATSSTDATASSPSDFGSLSSAFGTPKAVPVSERVPQQQQTGLDINSVGNNGINSQIVTGQHPAAPAPPPVRHQPPAMPSNNQTTGPGIYAHQAKPYDQAPQSTRDSLQPLSPSSDGSSNPSAAPSLPAALPQGVQPSFNPTQAQRANGSAVPQTAADIPPNDQLVINPYRSPEQRLQAAQDNLKRAIEPKESNSNWDAVGGPGLDKDNPRRPYPNIDFSNTPVADVMNWQNAPENTYKIHNPNGSYSTQHRAVGILQELPGTIDQFYPKNGRSTQPFTHDVQENIGNALLNHAGVQAFIDGNKSGSEFTRNVSGIWNVVPRDESGLTHDSGANRGNKQALISPAEWQAYLKKVKDAGADTGYPAPPLGAVSIPDPQSLIGPTQSGLFGSGYAKFMSDKSRT